MYFERICVKYQMINILMNDYNAIYNTNCQDKAFVKEDFIKKLQKSSSLTSI